MTQLATNATIADVIASLQGTVGTLQKKTGVVITPSNTDIPITLGTFDGTGASGKVLAVPVDASKVVSGTVIAGTTGTATIESLGGKKFASGTGSSGTTINTVTGLSFKPELVITLCNGNYYMYFTVRNTTTNYMIGQTYSYNGCSVNSSGFTVVVGETTAPTWWAFE